MAEIRINVARLESDMSGFAGFFEPADVLRNLKAYAFGRSHRFVETREGDLVSVAGQDAADAGPEVRDIVVILIGLAAKPRVGFGDRAMPPS